MAAKAQGNNEDSGILATKILQIAQKRYYLDVKENTYGRFLKIAETAQNGRKSRMIVPFYLLPEVQTILKKFQEHLSTLPEFEDVKRAAGDARNNQESEAAKELDEGLVERGRRKLHFNLKENNRGRYVRIKAIGDLPQNARYSNRNRRRSKESDGSAVPRAIIMPAIGIDEFINQLAGLWKDYPVDPKNDKVATADDNESAENQNLPESLRLSSREFRKAVFLDAGKNTRGLFAKITELQNSFRESVVIPREHFEAVGAWFLEAAKNHPKEEKPIEEKLEKLNLDTDNSKQQSRRRLEASE